MGININYAPVCDLLTNLRNTSLGTRAFGDDPAQVSRLASAMTEGLQSVGVAASAKHFPGYGEVTTDAHYDLPRIPHGLERLRQMELPPFQAAVDAGVRLIMTGHMALPALNEGLDLPATLSPRLLREILRRKMGYTGLVVTDALDMHAIQQGDGLLIDCLAAFAAGVDLLLFGPATDQGDRLQAGLLQAVRRGLLPIKELQASAARVLALKDWLSGFEQPDLNVVGCREHQALALETARRSVTCVRDRDGLLPLQAPTALPWLALTPIPDDLTPAETSSYVSLKLRDTLQLGGVQADEIFFSLDPSEAELHSLLERLDSYAGILVGTFNAIDYPGQIALLQALAESSISVIAVALRSPFDVSLYPEIGTCLCTYSIQPAAIRALGEALWSRIPFSGILPVKMPVQ